MTVKWTNVDYNCDICQDYKKCYFVYAFNYDEIPIKDKIYGKYYCKKCWNNFNKLKKYRIENPYNNRIRCEFEGSSHPCIVCGTYIDNNLLWCPGDEKCFRLGKKRGLCLKQFHNHNENNNGIHKLKISNFSWESYIYYDCENCDYSFKIKKQTEVKKQHRTAFGKLRHLILKNSNYKCRECGATNEDTKLEIDHIKPWSKGGLTELENLQVLCRKCNHAKNTREWRAGE